MESYSIVGIWYSHPRSTINASGEVVYGRVGVSVFIGTRMTVENKAFKVTRIEYLKDLGEFYVHLEGEGLITIPKKEDTEVYYKLNEAK